MCHVPSIAVFCSESIEYFPGMASKFFFKSFVTIPVAPVITAIIIHFMFHVSCVSVYKLLYYTFYSAFVWHFCPLLLPHLSVCMFSLFCFNYYISCFSVTSLCVPLDSIAVSHLHVHIHVWVCLSFWCLVLCISNNVNLHKLYHVSLSIHSSPKWGILRSGGQ